MHHLPVLEIPILVLEIVLSARVPHASRQPVCSFCHLRWTECFPCRLNIHVFKYLRECVCVMFYLAVLSLTPPISLVLNYEP